jgi:hypothetical protein
MGAAVAGTALGCGLISSDITKVTFDLPMKSYHFDTSGLNIPAGNTQEIPCGPTQLVMDCCNPPAPLPAPDCSSPTTNITCATNAQGNDVCTAEVTVTQTASMNLGSEVPKLSSATSLANLSISRIAYTVTNNTLNVDLPPMVIYLAPNGITDPNDPNAKRFGTVPTIPAGTTPSGTVSLEPNAAATFSSFTQSLSTPFNFIITTTVEVPSGTPIPSGAIDVGVTGTLSASL